jgi:hypothetical protein
MLFFISEHPIITLFIIWALLNFIENLIKLFLKRKHKDGNK